MSGSSVSQLFRLAKKAAGTQVCTCVKQVGIWQAKGLLLDFGKELSRFLKAVSCEVHILLRLSRIGSSVLFRFRNLK
jgi:hypothetical protein